MVLFLIPVIGPILTGPIFVAIPLIAMIPVIGAPLAAVLGVIAA